MSIEILRLEMRRSVGFWFCPLLIGMGSWMAVTQLPRGVWLWPATGSAIRQSLFFLGPLTAALAAWIAGRDRRRGIDELLATMPFPVTVRDLTVWAGTAGWGLLAYLVVAVYLLVLTWQQATWGGPPLAPIIEGGLAIGAHAALGYAIGSYLPTRFTAPLVAVVMFVAQGLPTDLPTALKYLSPISGEQASVFYPFEPYLAVPKALWLLGLAGIGLVAIGLQKRRTFLRWSAFLVALLVAVTGATLVQHSGAIGLPNEVPYTPVCITGHIEVCVHPAYRAVLPDVAATVEAVARPLLGIPGVPKRFEQRPGAALLPDGTLAFDLYEAPTSYLAPQIAHMLVQDVDAVVPICTKNTDQSDSSGVSCSHEENRAQQVIIAWLAQQAGFKNDEVVIMDPADQTAQAALQRFSALEPGAQRHWLEANYGALRAGQLTLEALP